jgi:hypothetical protein
MFLFAHLHKCAGTSVVRAAQDAGLVLPPGHVNGHPPGKDGRPLGGLSWMSVAKLDGVLRPLVQAGVQLTAIEWDFPRFEKFPTDLGLRFFTIVRDPLERMLSNYAYNVTTSRNPARNLQDWMANSGIWTQPNYYCRFFSGLRARDAVASSHVDYAAGVLSAHFKVGFFGDDLLDFLAADVGLPIRSFPKTNAVSPWRKFLKRSRLRISPGERERLREMNALDYQLYDRLLSRQGARLSAAGSRADPRFSALA